MNTPSQLGGGTRTGGGVDVDEDPVDPRIDVHRGQREPGDLHPCGRAASTREGGTRVYILKLLVDLLSWVLEEYEYLVAFTAIRVQCTVSNTEQI